MPSPDHFIANHRQLFQFSCIPSVVEMILKLNGRVPEDYYELQKAWGNRSDGNFLDFHEKTIKGLTFRATYTPPVRNENFPLGELFEKIEQELDAERYVAVSLNIPFPWHNYLVYSRQGGEYLGITRGVQPEQIACVKSTIESMRGTDILTYYDAGH